MAGPPPYPILEYAEYGNLRAFLRHQRNIGSVIQKVEMICISMKFIVEKAIEIAAGMNYLAEQSVVHGDLAARNVLGPFKFVYRYFSLTVVSIFKQLVQEGVFAIFDL